MVDRVPNVDAGDGGDKQVAPRLDHIRCGDNSINDLTIAGKRRSETSVVSGLHASTSSRTRRDGALRCAAEPGSAERYVLYGLDQLAARGDAVAHNLETPRPLCRAGLGLPTGR